MGTKPKLKKKLATLSVTETHIERAEILSKDILGKDNANVSWYFRYLIDREWKERELEQTKTL